MGGVVDLRSLGSLGSLRRVPSTLLFTHNLFLKISKFPNLTKFTITPSSPPSPPPPKKILRTREGFAIFKSQFNAV